MKTVLALLILLVSSISSAENRVVVVPLDGDKPGCELGGAFCRAGDNNNCVYNKELCCFVSANGLSCDEATQRCEAIGPWAGELPHPSSCRAVGVCDSYQSFCDRLSEEQ